MGENENRGHNDSILLLEGMKFHAQGHEFHARAISCPEVNSRIEQSFEFGGSCNQYRAQGLMKIAVFENVQDASQVFKQRNWQKPL